MTAVMVGSPILLALMPGVCSFLDACARSVRCEPVISRCPAGCGRGSPDVPWHREGPMPRPLPDDQGCLPGSGLPAEACFLGRAHARHSGYRAVGEQLGTGVEVAEARRRARLLAGPH